MNFEEQFPSLDHTAQKNYHKGMYDHRDIAENCLDKQRMREATDKLIDEYKEKGWKGRKNAIIRLKKELGL